MTRKRGESGVILLLVLFFALLLSGSVATFMRRATVDALIARNYEAVARAEALARGGVQVGTALLVDDLVREAEGDVPVDGHRDRWFNVRNLTLPDESGAALSLRIEDAGARLNLNALFDASDGGALDERTEAFLVAVFEKIIDEMPPDPERARYDPKELARNLVDWIDADDERVGGGPEDAYYQSQTPPYRAANRPLLSADELGLIEGFDRELVEAVAPYVSVYPFAGGGGINLNTAPPHVLSLLYFDDGVDLRLATEDVVRQILRVREQGLLFCADGGEVVGCTGIREIVTNALYPEPTYRSTVFRIFSEARVGEVRREVEAVVQRGEEAAPTLLSWRVR